MPTEIHYKNTVKLYHEAIHLIPNKWYCCKNISFIYLFSLYLTLKNINFNFGYNYKMMILLCHLMASPQKCSAHFTPT